MEAGDCMNNIVGIKLADGSFYPILEEGLASSKLLELTTVRDDQETVQLDLYKAIDGDEKTLEYVDTLLIENLLPRPKEEPTLSLTLAIDDDDVLSASIEEAESGESTSLSVSLLNSSEPTQLGSPDFALADSEQKVTLPSMSYMDDVPRETPNEEGLAETVDEFHTEEDFAIDMSSAEEESTEDFKLDEATIDFETEGNQDTDDTILDEAEFEIDIPFEADTSDQESDTLDDFDVNLDDETFDMGFDDSNEENLDIATDDELEIKLDENIDENTGEALSSNEVLTEDSFPSFPDDLEISEPETSLDGNEEEGFARSMYNFGDSLDDEIESQNINENDYNTEALDDSIPAPEFSFSDLYEKDDYVEEEKVKEQKNEGSKRNWILFLLVILLLLACLGLLAFLFLGNRGDKTKIETHDGNTELVAENRFAAEPSVEPIPEEVKTDSAKENEIVKVDTEFVVPEPVKETVPEAEAVQYKIKWGDTLWDISNAYYKTPWLYPKIASYNGIKNPDFIISGTWITIPPK